MKKGRNTAEKFEEYDELDLEQLEEEADSDRTLVLKAAPPSRRMQLLAHGATDVRCSWCQEVRPLESAQDSEEGWICGDCSQYVTPETIIMRTKGKVLPC